VTATPHLDKLLALAADASEDDHSGPDLGDEGRSDWDEADWDDVRSHLESQSPWFKQVMAGEHPGEPDADDVQLTPRTAEASTVPQPTVGPGGPGLFHIKGRELPPYVQHLYKHLVAKYGKHRAYGVAIGIVKKWAKGINPGGKGKGHKVHSDVQAAAARNVANWEESKAMAHKHHGDHKDRKVAASNVALAKPYERHSSTGKLEQVSGYQRKLLAQTRDGYKIFSRPDGNVDVHWHTPSGRLAYTNVVPRSNAAVNAELKRHRVEIAREREDEEHLADIEGREPELSNVFLAVVSDFERTVAGRMEHVHGYVRDNRLKIGQIGPESPVAKTELSSLYRTHKEDEAAFRDHLREARAHYAAGRHEEAKAAIGRAQDVARSHSLNFAADALERQKQAIDAEQARAAAKAQTAIPMKQRRGLLGKFGRKPSMVAASHLETVLALAEVRGYERVEHGHEEYVRPHNANFLRAQAEGKPRTPFKKNIVFDFDGTLTDDRNGHHKPGHVDFRGIREAHRRGYTVAVVSAWPRQGIVSKLREHGFDAFLDQAPSREFWHGGENGRQIIVTGNKVSAAGYIDDKAINHQPGDDWTHTLDQVERLNHGFIPEPQPDSDRRRFDHDKMGVQRLHRSLDDRNAGLDLSRSQGEIRVWLAAPASWPSGKPYKESYLPPGPTTGLKQGQQTRTGVIVNAPGSKPALYGQLRQAPAQTVSPSPPLPPDAKLPTPKDLLSLTAEVPTGPDVTLDNSIREHLRTAAGKLSKNDNDGALYALRGAQTGVHAAYRAAYGENLPVTMRAYGINSLVPPAEQSSATTAMLKGREVTEGYRKLHHKITGHIDIMRRHHFHGMWQGMPEARFAGRTTPMEEIRLAQVHGYERENRFGRIVNVSGYMREGKPYTGKLVGDEADEAIKAGAARGEFGEPTGYFQTSDGKKMWGWYGAAGLLIRHTAPDGAQRYLLQKRAPWVDNGNTYSVPGGALDAHEGKPETPVEGAIREGREEGMELPEGTTHAETRSNTFGEGKGAWSYHTVVMDTPRMFTPGSKEAGGSDTTGESRGYVWATPQEMADLPLHPHFRATAESLGMPKGGGTRPPEQPGFDPEKMFEAGSSDKEAGMSRTTTAALSRVLEAAGVKHK